MSFIHDRELPPVRSTPKSNHHIIGGYILGESAKAIYLEIHQVNGENVSIDNPKQWFPLSQITSIYRNKSPGGELDTITASDWICKQKDIPV